MKEKGIGKAVSEKRGCEAERDDDKVDSCRVSVREVGVYGGKVGRVVVKDVVEDTE